jgi:phenylalanyl-tRNA synthetase alpha chain
MNELIEKIRAIRRSAMTELSAVTRPDELKNWRIKYLSNKGELTSLLKQLGDLSPTEKPLTGKEANEAKQVLNDNYQQKKQSLNQPPITGISLDPTLPGSPYPSGHPHPLLETLFDLTDIFQELGFAVRFGPEIETEWNNFTALNFPPQHPARDLHDTFYIQSDRPEKLILRTHTSPIQIRTMLAEKPPLRIVAPGRVFRHEATDAAHSVVFYQIEGFAVDKNISLGHLKWVLHTFIQKYFGRWAKIRFQPSYFPFTEPSLEVYVSCPLCQGKGCRVCKNQGDLEMLGAGMIHPGVFRAVKYEPRWRGFAFGLGVDRFAMFRHNIDDMRLFYENDWRFSRQF